MRFCLLFFALVAAATAIPPLEKQAGNVATLKKQRDVLSLLEQLFGKIPNSELEKIGKRFKPIENLENYNDQLLVKLITRRVERGYYQNKGEPWTCSNQYLRKEVALISKLLLCAKDYDTFLKTAAWARIIFNEEQFYKAFTAAVLQHKETQSITLPAPYEVFPYYYVDARVIREAQRLRTYTQTNSANITQSLVIPYDQKPLIKSPENRITYFTQDIGLSAWYYYFSLAGFMIPQEQTSENVGTQNGRGEHYCYTHQQLLARYNLERISNDLPPINDVNFETVNNPFRSHLSYPNGLEMSGRGELYIPKGEKNLLGNTVQRLIRRLGDAIDSGFGISGKGNIVSLHNKAGLDLIGNIIENSGRSINPRYYGSLQGAARALLGGSPNVEAFSSPLPSALENFQTATRDPVFYRLWKRIIKMIKRYQDSLPSYEAKDLILPGVQIESVKFDKLSTYCEKTEIDIDSATEIPKGAKPENIVQLKTTVERINHKPFNYQIVINSNKTIKNAVVRVFLGPEYDYDCEYCNIRDNRLSFVELDQFLADVNEGKTVLLRNSIQAPMRSGDLPSLKDLRQNVEKGLSSSGVFYPDLYTHGFPERMALPRGKSNGQRFQVMVIVSSPDPKPVSYDAVIPPESNPYQQLATPELEESLQPGREINIEEGQGANYGYKQRGFEIVKDVAEEVLNEFRGYGLYEGHIYVQEQIQNLERAQNSEQTSHVEKLNRDALINYYKSKHISEVIGGAVSLDGRPLGYPLERSLDLGCLNVPNVKVVEVKVFFEGQTPCERTAQDRY